MFIAIGAVSLMWLVPWCFVASRFKLRQEVSPIEAAHLREILSKRAFWGDCSAYSAQTTRGICC